MKKRHFFILLLTVLLLTNSIAVFADSLIFTDIKDNWAKEFIEDIYNRKITQGYTDATFRPGNSISNLETCVMLGNMLKVTADSNLLLKYEDIIKQYNIPSWAQNQVVYLLDKNVLLESEVKSFVTNNTANNAKRHEVATYIGRVLVEVGGKSISRSYYIPYKDELSIPNDAKPYIDLLLSLDILNKESNDGQFNPNNNITRAEVAKLMALTAEILDDVTDIEKPPVDTPKEEPKETPADTAEVEGIINTIVVANRTVLTIYDKSNKTSVYDVKDTAVVTIDSKVESLTALEKGQIVKLKVVDAIVEEIVAKSNKEAVVGYFQRVFTNEGKEILTVKTLKGDYKYYNVIDTTRLYLNDNLNTFDKLKVGDALTVYINGDNVYEVVAKSKNLTIKGVVQAKGTTNDRWLEVFTNEDKYIKVTFDSGTTVNRNGRTSNFNNIKVYDEISLDMEYDTVKAATASSVRRSFEGTIKRIYNDADQQMITVENKDLETEDFVIGVTTTIYVDNNTGTFYDLRLNYLVTVNIENNEITSVSTSKSITADNIIGRVKSINRDNNTMTVLVEQNGTTKEMQVHVKNNTSFIGKTGGSWSFSKVQEGDILLLVGTTINGSFVLDRVVLVN